MANILLWCVLAAGLLFASTATGVVGLGEGCAPNFLEGPYRCDGVLCGFAEVVAPGRLPARPCYLLDLAFFVGVPVFLVLTLPLSSRHGFGSAARARRRRREWDAGAPPARVPPPAPPADARPGKDRHRSRRGGFDPRRLGIGPPRPPRGAD